MRRRSVYFLALVIWIFSDLGAAAPGAVLHGITHDSQHRPVPGVSVTLASAGLNWKGSARSDQNGEFEFRNVPPGNYTVSATAAGFQTLSEQLEVHAEGNGVVHLQMKLAAVRQSVTVSGAPATLATETSTTQTVISSKEITQTPGAGLANSMAMITDFVPGATMVHDMLHVRGGHQESWFFDGIPVLNTNIASNVGPLIDPRNVESLQAQTGGYASEYGDRTYGFFNVVTPSGFDRNSEGNLIATYGSFNRTDDLLSFGSHTERFAYYASIDGNRSDLGLATPTPEIIHDQASGLSGFASVLYNPSTKNQIRIIASLDASHFQIPNDQAAQASGIRDFDLERDDMLGFTWAHSSPGGAVLTFSPFLNYNRADYLGGPADTPFVLNNNRRSTYLGALATLAVPKGRHNLRAGIEVWGQHDNTFFSLAANPGSRILAQKFLPWGNSEAIFAGDQVKLNSWLSLNAGIRLSHYGGLVSENAADPRAGATLRIPRTSWLLHGYYAAYYQPPPLDTVEGSLLNFALDQGFSFVPLPGERDHQWDVGLSVPLHRWSLDADHFRTSAGNFLDHDEVGNSDIFLPLTDLAAIIRGTEVSVRSPEIFGRVQWRVAYSNQLAEGLGPVTGGLIEFAPTSYFLLDHDQRNTVSSALNVRLPWRSWADATYSFGSGFLNGNGPAHLPPHSVADLALGKSFGERFSISVNALNLTNARFQLDDSNTFGGTHFVDPRELYVELRWRFHY